MLVRRIAHSFLSEFLSEIFSQSLGPCFQGFTPPPQKKLHPPNSRLEGDQILAVDTPKNLCEVSTSNFCERRVSAKDKLGWTNFNLGNACSYLRIDRGLEEPNVKGQNWFDTAA